jgi:hypothetical protein
VIAPSHIVTVGPAAEVGRRGIVVDYGSRGVFLHTVELPPLQLDETTRVRPLTARERREAADGS